MTEQEWVSCTDPNKLLQVVSTFPQTERKWICAMLAFSDHTLVRPDKYALELRATMAKYADGIIARPQVADHFEAAMRGNGIDVTFDYGETVLYLNEAVQSGAKTETLAATMHDIFGNPFHSLSLDPAWLSWNDGTVKKVAQAIYDDSVFDRLPILAEALERAGCDDADILAHCRGPGPHVRGCWVVDLLLEKGKQP